MVMEELKERMDEHRVAYYEEHYEELSRSDLFNFTAKLFFGLPLAEEEIEVLRRWTDISNIAMHEGGQVVAFGGIGHEYEGRGRIVEGTADDRGRVRMGTDLAGQDVLAAAFGAQPTPEGVEVDGDDD